MVYMITDYTGKVYFDTLKRYYYAIEYSNRVGDTVDKKFVKSSVRIGPDNISDYGEIAYFDGMKYYFASVTPITMRDVPLQKLLWNIFTMARMMFGKTLYIYCIGDGEFEITTHKQILKYQLVGKTKISDRETFFKLCGIDTDANFCFEYDGEIEGSGLQCVGHGKVQVVDWSLFFHYVAREWQVDFVYGGE